MNENDKIEFDKRMHVCLFLRNQKKRRNKTLAFKCFQSSNLNNICLYLFCVVSQYIKLWHMVRMGSCLLRNDIMH